MLGLTVHRGRMANLRFVVLMLGRDRGLITIWWRDLGGFLRLQFWSRYYLTHD